MKGNRNSERLTNLFYFIAALVVVMGAIMRILHVEFAGLLLFIGFAIGLFVSVFHITRLKNRVNELENK